MTKFIYYISCLKIMTKFIYYISCLKIMTKFIYYISCLKWRCDPVFVSCNTLRCHDTYELYWGPRTSKNILPFFSLSLTLAEVPCFTLTVKENEAQLRSWLATFVSTKNWNKFSPPFFKTLTSPGINLKFVVL